MYLEALWIVEIDWVDLVGIFSDLLKVLPNSIAQISKLFLALKLHTELESCIVQS